MTKEPSMTPQMRKEKDGERRYGCWAGDPDGYPEQLERCIEEVAEPGRTINRYQCTRRRGHGPEGLYCKQHGKRAAEKENERER